MSISYTELRGSGAVRLTQQGMRGIRLLRVATFADAQPLASQLLGTTARIGTEIVRLPPARFAAGSPMFCVAVLIEGLGRPQQDSSGKIEYDGGAKLTVTYQTLPYDPESDTEPNPNVGKYLTEELSISGRFLSLPRSGYAWSGDAEPLRANDPQPGKLLPEAEYRLTRHKVPELAKGAIFGLIGSVNESLFGEAAAETLLFVGAEARREHDSSGARNWRIELVFQYHPHGHNKCFRASSGNFETLETISGGAKLYPTADFSLLVPEVGG